MTLKKLIKIVVKLVGTSLEFVNVVFVRTSDRIFAIGDSHVRPLGGRRGVFRRHLGPMTLHRFGRPGEATKALASLRHMWPSRKEFRGGLSLPTIVLSFGEIDIRVHVHHQAKLSKVSELEIIDRLVHSALNGIAEMRKVTCARIIFLAPTPPTDIISSLQFPSSGSLSDRILWTRYFCHKLETAFATEGDRLVRLLDVSSNFITAEGALSDQYGDGNVHYGRAAARFVTARIKETAKQF